MRQASRVILLAALVAIPFVPNTGTAASGCSLDLAKLRTHDCVIVKGDSGTRPDPVPLWGDLACVNAKREREVGPGGDRHTKAEGGAAGNRRFRQLTVVDGDNFYGERCELGNNSWKDPTFVNYYEGDHMVTFVSLRLPRNFQLHRQLWQTVIQMKQSQPSDDSTGGPVLELQAFRGRFMLFHNWNELWSTKARKRRWIRFAFDVHYSQSANRGSIAVYADKNGDGDARDRGERSPVFHVATLRTEPTGTFSDGLWPGQPIPSHLRVGIYHDPSYRCLPPGGCSIRADNVQVVRAP